MSSTTVQTSTDVRPSPTLAARVRQYVGARQSRRALDAVLAGHHGATMREEVLARLNR